MSFELTDHPTFKQPTIAEVVCEVHFTVAPDAGWSPTNPGNFWKEVAADYPDIEPIVETGIGFRLNPNSGIEQVLTEKKRYRFTNTSKSNMLHVAENLFTINMLPPYPGFPALRRELENRWESARKIFKPQQVARIGLRYINKIARRSADELASYWIKETDFIAKAALNSPPPFLSRVEARFNETDRAVVNIGHLKNDAPDGYLIFDIDCIRQSSISSESAAVSQSARELNEAAWLIFSSAHRGTLTAYLEGR